MQVQKVWLKKFNRIVICLLPVALVACSTPLERESADAANVYLQLGVRYLSLNNLPSAKENLELALQSDSDSIPAHIALAFLYEKLNKYDEARKQYDIALNLDPENLNLQNNFGRFLCDRREFDKGLALLTQASTNMLNENPWMALTNAGRCQMAMGDRKKAGAYFEKALESNPNYAPALQEMQRMSYQNGDFKASRDYLDRYLTVADHTPESLWLAIQTEQALGNEILVKEYTNLLLEKFPYSNEAKQIKSTLRPQ
jgi:type IV pilus assembly protein PilF